jgi:hypothetical protein
VITFFCYPEIAPFHWEINKPTFRTNSKIRKLLQTTHVIDKYETRGISKFSAQTAKNIYIYILFQDERNIHCRYAHMRNIKSNLNYSRYPISINPGKYCSKCGGKELAPLNRANTGM